MDFEVSRLNYNETLHKFAFAVARPLKKKDLQSPRAVQEHEGGAPASGDEWDAALRERGIVAVFASHEEGTLNSFLAAIQSLGVKVKGRS